jgi:hypothetical protein
MSHIADSGTPSPTGLPAGAESLGLGDLPEAANLLALLQPHLSDPVWLSHLQTILTVGGHVCGLREAGRLVAMVAVEPAEIAWQQTWRPAASITGLAVLPGPGGLGRVRTLVRAVVALTQAQGAMVLLADTAPWAPAVGFVPQAPIPYWSLAPEGLRRFLRCEPLRPVTADDLAALAELYDRRALALGGAQRRCAADWQRLFGQRSPLGPLHLVAAVRDGVCLAYAVVRGGDATSNRVVVSIDEWLDDGQTGLPAIVSFLSQLQGRAMAIQVPVPPDRSFAAWLTQAAPVSAQLTFGPCLQVIDPAAAVADLLPGVAVTEANGRVQLSFADGMMSMAGTVLSSLVGGSLDGPTALAQGDLTGDAAACAAFAEAWPATPSFRFPQAGRRFP